MADHKVIGSVSVAWLLCFRFFLLSWIIVTTASANTRILLGQQASEVERHAANELLADVRKVCPREEISIERYTPLWKENFEGNVILLGTSTTHAYFNTSEALSNFSLLGESLEPETFVLQTGELEDGNTSSLLIIKGADDRGVLYGVYEFSKRVMGIDAMEFWTGKRPLAQSNLVIPDLAYREREPRFKLRGYFDNDNDMLANWRGKKLIVEFDIWKEMIDTLARLRYNYVDIHDLLGRPEYYLREYYTEMTEYHTDLELVDQVIDYAHSKGLLVQIPMYLGWEFKHLSMDQVCLTEHFDTWMDIYKYYLTETPLGKGDLFLARPRHPIYDWPYTCPEEEALGVGVGPLMEVVFSGLGKLIHYYRPGGVLVCDLWQEGRALWIKGEFSPIREIPMLWADNGFAEFEEWPKDHRGYPFGVYIHAGVWKNQVVQDPYPQRIKNALMEAASRDMTENCLVNGQSFKPFILNLEACGRAMWNPEEFNADDFYQEWTSRYFGTNAAEFTVQSLQLLHQAHQFAVGYREITKASQKILKNLNQDKPEPVDMTPTRTALALARRSLELAEEAEALVAKTARDVFDDQIRFPATLFVQNLELLSSLIELNNVYNELGKRRRDPEKRQQLVDSCRFAREKLLTLRTSLEVGSRWKKWNKWTHPSHFRIHTPPPELEEVDSLLESLGASAKK